MFLLQEWKKHYKNKTELGNWRSVKGAKINCANQDGAAGSLYARRHCFVRHV